MRLQANGNFSCLLFPLVVGLVLHHAPSVRALNVVITSLTVPGATSVSISALNQTGQVAGVYTTSDGARRTFLWSRTSLQDVGTLGGVNAEASTLNNAGAVVGQSDTAAPGQTHGFLFSNGVLSDLGPDGSPFSSAFALNDSGQVAGYYLSGPLQHAFVFSGGTLTDLGTLGGSFSSPVAINAAGQVAGESTTTGEAARHAFLFSGGVMRDLGALGGSFSFSTSLNSAGQVTGMGSTASESELHAFLYNGTAMLDLGTLGGTFSIGYVINEAGHVIGDSMITADAEDHAFLFSDGMMRDLGTLGGGYSTPIGLNNRDQVVGIAATAAGANRAFLWQNGAMLDLNTLLPAGSGWDLDAAYYINDNGQIVGTGTYHDQPSWFLMETAARSNQPPLANAGSDQIIDCAGANTAAALDGSASSDPDGDALTYEWRHGQDVLATGPTVTVALALGSYTFTLRVTDSHGATSEASVVVNCVDRQPPVVQCPAGATASADQQGQAAVPDFLAGTMASDACTPGTLLTRTQNPPAGSPAGLGTTVVVVSVSDSSGNGSVCTTTFTVVDTTPPIVNCPTSVTLSAGKDGQAAMPNLLEKLVASDNCTAASSLVKAQSPAAGKRFGRGKYPVTVTVTDAAGNATTCTTTLTVVDTTPPTILSLSATPDVLDPIRRQMVPVSLKVFAIDNCDAKILCQIVSVTSSEAVTGPGDNTAPDWEVTGPLTLNLRAEDTDHLAPRVYTITVQSSDASGNVSTATVSVTASKHDGHQAAAKVVKANAVITAKSHGRK